MASPCELLLAGGDEREAALLTQAVADEAWRIEQKFSRYRDDNMVHAINTSAGKPVRVDEETAGLLDFADTCYRISDGHFDITSGVLRKVWKFDGSDRLPSRQTVKALLQDVGWARVVWRKPLLTLPAGMEIDFGGIGKEYAVDRCALIVAGRFSSGALVNFGGDLRATGPRERGVPWTVGIEQVRENDAPLHLQLSTGAIATSGDARRFLLKDGVRYGHVLDPRTGWPVAGAPRSVTVIDDTCTQAGLLATLALLQGKGAEDFLETQNVRYKVLR